MFLIIYDAFCIIIKLFFSVSFMDAFLSALPDEPMCDKLHSIEEASLSRKDVKVSFISS